MTDTNSDHQHGLTDPDNASSANARDGSHEDGTGGQRPAHDQAHTRRETHPPLLVELRDHLPFSVSAVALGLIFAGIVCVFINVSRTPAPGEHAAADVLRENEAQVEHEHDDDHGSGGGHEHGGSPALLLFHLFHPAHMLFSAAATAAMFVRYERKYLKAVLVGLLGAIVICGISDIIMPHLSLWLLGFKVPLHLCIIEHPGMVLPFALAGVALGLLASIGVSRSTLFSHSLHVFTSTMASIFYLVGGIGIIAWIDRIGVVFFFVLAAVMVPCCLSDIVFPLAMSRQGRVLYQQVPHSH